MMDKKELFKRDIHIARKYYRNGNLKQSIIDGFKKKGLFYLIEGDLYELRAIKIAKEVLNWIKKNERLPSKYSKDKVEKKFGRWIITQRQAKQGKGEVRWYPQIEKIFKDGGYPDVFETRRIENNKSPEEKAKEVLTWIKKNEKLPSSISKDKVEKKFGRWIITQRQAKQGKGTSKWYHSIEKIFKDAGYPDIFEIENNKSPEEKAKEVLNWIKKNKKIPSQHSKDKVEKKFGLWIQTQRKAKRGKGNRRWYPQIEKIFKDGGYPDIFETINLEEEIIDKAKEVLNWIKKNKRLPSQYSKDKVEKKFGLWIQTQRKAKRGKGNRRWYPQIEKMFKDGGYPYIFNPRGKKK